MNQSLISLNHSHHQGRNIGFSWRVLDILASSSLLITEKSTIISEKFGKNIKKQFYSSAYDVRKKCDYFLKNKNARSDLIAEQNEIIDKFYRWEDRIKKIEDIFGLKSEINTISSIKIFRAKNYNLKPTLFLFLVTRFIKSIMVYYSNIFIIFIFLFIKKRCFVIYKFLARVKYFYYLKKK